MVQKTRKVFFLSVSLIRVSRHMCRLCSGNTAEILGDRGSIFAFEKCNGREQRTIKNVKQVLTRET